ncbi:hypothetical protein [Absidia glauca]|uniref:Uncharacterized protein n=1 Tax=Absidia glauca TaxID=4829 RepID=A0A163JMS2_ABSGL|nr:hypothetical protein [Absidia glauca]
MTTRFAYVVQDDSPGESDEEGSSVETYQPSIEMADEGMQNRDNTMATILSIINNGPYSQVLSKRKYVELSDDACRMMNDSWLLLPSLRYACSQLLAGSIITNNNNEAIIVNSVEIYGRDRIMDEHRERSVNMEGVPVPSSLPPVPSKYHKTWVTMISEAEGKKLVFGTTSWSALVTSSLRIDMDHPASVGGTTAHFDLDPRENAATTTILLDADSIRMANALALAPHTDRIRHYDLLYQLRQLQTEFQDPSTYTMCHASGPFTDDLQRRPYTVFTLSSFDGDDLDFNTMLASQLFAFVAASVFKAEPSCRGLSVGSQRSNCHHQL